MSFLKHKKRCLIVIFIVTRAFVEEQKHEGCS